MYSTDSSRARLNSCLRFTPPEKVTGDSLPVTGESSGYDFSGSMSSTNVSSWLLFSGALRLTLP